MLNAFKINIPEVTQKLLEILLEYGPNIALTLGFLFLGLRSIPNIVKISMAPFRDTDKTLKTFIKSLLTWSLKIILFITVATMIGIKTTSFVAILGAASLAIGLALQGTLANFAGGVLCLIFKPYQVGDIVTVQDIKGKVKEIQIFTTILITRNNEAVIIPNGAIMNGNIINHSLKGKLRVEVELNADSSIPFKYLKEEILKQIGTDDEIFHTPKPTVNIASLDGDIMGIIIRVWCQPDSYWNVYFSSLELSKKAIENISD